MSAAAKISDATPDARLNARIIIRPTSIALRGIECFWTANPSGQRKCGQHSLCRLGDAQQKPGWSLLDPLAPAFAGAIKPSYVLDHVADVLGADILALPPNHFVGAVTGRAAVAVKQQHEFVVRLDAVELQPHALF